MRRRSEGRQFEASHEIHNSLWVKKMSIKKLIDGWDKGMRKQSIAEFSD